MSDKSMADVADNAINKLAAAIEAAANKAGPVASETWHAAVLAERVESIVWIVICLVLLASSVFCVRSSLAVIALEERRKARAVEANPYRDWVPVSNRSEMTFTVTAVVVFASVCAVLFLPLLISSALFPEVSVARELLGALK